MAALLACNWAVPMGLLLEILLVVCLGAQMAASKVCYLA